MRFSKSDISNYQRMTDTPAGAIMNHILHRVGMPQKELSKLTGIIPQHINALIKGTRRFSIEYSFIIEGALGMEACGFFYKCQCNYDIEQAKKEKQKKPDISRLRKATFWDVNLEKVNWQKGKRWAILRVLEYGCIDDYEEISRFYGRKSFLIEFMEAQRKCSDAMMRNASLFGLI